MPCHESASLPPGFTTTGRKSYKTEAECNQACQEGACCEGATCTVKPQCQCQGAGKVFRGIGTTCSPNPCLCCTNGASHPSGLIVEITSVSWVPGTYKLSFPVVGTYAIPFQGCLGYGDLFYKNSTGCAPASHPCFGGCSHKLQIDVVTGNARYGIFFGLADCDATDQGSRVITGGEAWGKIPTLEQTLCGGQFPIDGTTTDRNNPNFGGVLNAISYRITNA